jgi:osmotically-inducible protein OsmY
MTNNRWRDDERRWDEERSGRSGSSPGGWGQGETGREPYRSGAYESSGYAQGAYPDNEGRGRDEEYGRQSGQDDYRRRLGSRYRGGYDYERDRSGFDYGPSGQSASFGYGYDPYGSGEHGRGSQWRSGQHGQDWRSRQGMGGNIGRDWRSQDLGYRGYEGSYGGDWNQERGWWDRTRDEVRSWMGDDEAERRRNMDQMRQRSHYGRGPRGFTRSDERIREDACERLTYDWSVDASDVEVKVSNGEVTLTGSVESRYSKRRAEDIVDDVAGVRHVQNNLRVKEATEGTGSATAGTGTAARPTH